MKLDNIINEISKSNQLMVINRIRNIVDIKGSKAINTIKNHIKLNNMDSIVDILRSFGIVELQRTLIELEKL